MGGGRRQSEASLALDAWEARARRGGRRYYTGRHWASCLLEAALDSRATWEHWEEIDGNEDGGNDPGLCVLGGASHFVLLDLSEVVEEQIESGYSWHHYIMAGVCSSNRSGRTLFFYMWWNTLFGYLCVCLEEQFDYVKYAGWALWWSACLAYMQGPGLIPSNTKNIKQRKVHKDSLFPLDTFQNLLSLPCGRVSLTKDK